jgi:F0F1-type ATP synthase epsilon subunit
MKIRILSSQEKLLEDEAKEVILPGEDGEFSVWDFHEPCLYRLRLGKIMVKLRKEKEKREFPIKRGLAKVEFDMLVALVEPF